MKRLLALLSLVVFVVMGTGCSSHKGALPDVVSFLPHGKLSNSELVAQTGGSTVALMMYFDEKETTQTTGYKPFCTGVWVDSTHILTADHCVKAVQRHEQGRLDERKERDKQEPGSLQELLQRLFNPRPEEPDTIEEMGLAVHYIVEKEVMEVGKEPSAWHLSKVVAHDPAHDLALLEAQGNLLPPHRIAKLAESTPEIGEHINVVGQMVGMYWTYTQGNVSAYRGADLMKGEDDKGPWMQVSAPVYYGNSGGGAFNDRGELVGIADWIKNAPDMAFFVHLDTVKSFLRSNKVLKK